MKILLLRRGYNYDGDTLVDKLQSRLHAAAISRLDLSQSNCRFTDWARNAMEISSRSRSPSSRSPNSNWLPIWLAMDRIKEEIEAWSERLASP